MDGYQERTASISVPKNTGVDGFLKTLRTILSLPRVQGINIDARGRVSYTRYVRDGEPDGAPSIDYTGLEPWAIVRNGQLDEFISEPGAIATTVVATMLNHVTVEGLVPVAFILGDASYFWKWHQSTAALSLSRSASAYGLPIYLDGQVPDSSLILCASFIKGSLLDCHRFLSVSMSPLADKPPETRVTIL